MPNHRDLTPDELRALAASAENRVPLGVTPSGDLAVAPTPRTDAGEVEQLRAQLGVGARCSVAETPGVREEAAVEMGRRACCRASIDAGFGPCDSCRADANAVLAVVAKHLKAAVQAWVDTGDVALVNALLAELKGAR